jgi:hypothetical protein
LTTEVKEIAKLVSNQHCLERRYLLNGEILRVGNATSGRSHICGFHIYTRAAWSTCISDHGQMDIEFRADRAPGRQNRTAEATNDSRETQVIAPSAEVCRGRYYVLSTIIDETPGHIDWSSQRERSGERTSWYVDNPALD